MTWKRSRHCGPGGRIRRADAVGAPFKGPIGAARVGFVNDEYVLNPTLDEMVETQLDLVVAGTADAVLMVESEAKELNEDIMLGAVMFGHRHFQPVIKRLSISPRRPRRSRAKFRPSTKARLRRKFWR